MLDIVLAAILLLSALTAARNGITREVIRLASLVAGLMLAMWGYGLLAPLLQPHVESARLAAGAAFAAIFVGCLIAGTLLSYALGGVWSITGLRWLDMSLGGAFGVIRGLLVSAVLLLSLLAFQPFPGTPDLVAGSRIAPWALNLARTAAAMAPSGLKEAFARGAALVDGERSQGRT